MLLVVGQAYLLGYNCDDEEELQAAQRWAGGYSAVLCLEVDVLKNSEFEACWNVRKVDKLNDDMVYPCWDVVLQVSGTLLIGFCIWQHVYSIII